MVLDATGGSDHNVQTAAEGALLGSVRTATVQALCREAERRANVLEVSVHLTQAGARSEMHRKGLGDAAEVGGSFSRASKCGVAILVAWSGLRLYGTCLASSRVGSSTMTDGVRPNFRRPPGPAMVARRSTIGSTKARVLPHPVRARPTRSLPSSNSVRVCACRVQRTLRFKMWIATAAFTSKRNLGSGMVTELISTHISCITQHSYFVKTLSPMAEKFVGLF